MIQQQMVVVRCMCSCVFATVQPIRIMTEQMCSLNDGQHNNSCMKWQHFTSMMCWTCMHLCWQHRVPCLPWHLLLHQIFQTTHEHFQMQCTPLTTTVVLQWKHLMILQRHGFTCIRTGQTTTKIWPQLPLETKVEWFQSLVLTKVGCQWATIHLWNTMLQHKNVVGWLKTGWKDLVGWIVCFCFSNCGLHPGIWVFESKQPLLGSCTQRHLRGPVHHCQHLATSRSNRSWFQKAKMNNSSTDGWSLQQKQKWHNTMFFFHDATCNAWCDAVQCTTQHATCNNSFNNVLQKAVPCFFAVAREDNRQTLSILGVGWLNKMAPAKETGWAVVDGGKGS